MIFAGVDVGSMSAEAVLLNDDEIRPDNLADYRSRLGSDGLLIDAAA